MGKMGLRHQRVGLILLAGITVFLLGSEAFRRSVAGPADGYVSSNLSDLLPSRLRQHSFLSSSKSLEYGAKLEDGQVCPTCNCEETASYLLSPWSGQLPTLDLLNSPQATKRDFAHYLSHNLFVQSQTDPIPVPDISRLEPYKKFSSCPDTLFSFSFKALKLHLPTAYAFTRTSRHGRLGAPEKRIRYLSRHAGTIKEFYELVRKEGYHDGVPAKDRQMLWLIIEDDDHINPEIAQWLLSSSIRTLDEFLSFYLLFPLSADYSSHTHSIHLYCPWSDQVSSANGLALTDPSPQDLTYRITGGSALLSGIWHIGSLFSFAILC